MPEGIAELTLQTTDLDRLERFYCDVIGLRLLQRQDDRVWVAAGPTSRLGLWAPGAKEFDDRPGAHVHFAISVRPQALNAIAERVRASGVPHEGPVEHDGGDRSLYWTDPAGHRGEAWELFASGGDVSDVAD